MIVQFCFVGTVSIPLALQSDQRRQLHVACRPAALRSRPASPDVQFAPEAGVQLVSALYKMHLGLCTS